MKKEGNGKLVVKKSDKSFSERVVEAALSIPPGRVSAYGRLARACGAGSMASQSITAILGKGLYGRRKGRSLSPHCLR